MTNTEIYVLLGVIFSITGFTSIVIYQHFKYNFPFSHDRNVLRRQHGDIELQDLIQPARELDLSSLPEYPTSQAIINYMPIRWPENYLPRYSQLTVNTATANYPPGYSQLSNNFINSPLELELWDLIPWLIFLFIIINFIIIIFKYFNTNILIFLNKLKLFIDPLYILPLLIPFSAFEIDFRDSFEWTLSSYKVKPKISYLKIQTLTEDIISLLNSLNFDENYSMSLAFISSYKEWVEDKEKKITPLLVEDAIIINNESDPFLITHFIMKSLDEKGYFITNWLLKDSSINSMDPVILTVTAPIKVKI